MMEYSIKTIIFDVDGTLMDTLELSIECFKKALLEVTGKEYTYNELVSSFGMVRKKALDMLGIKEKYHDLIEKIETSYYVNDERRKKLFANIEKVLTELDKMGIKLGIVTSRNEQEMKNDFLNLPMSNYFKVIVTSDQTKEHKPHPAPILKFIEKSGVDKDEVIYIGDTIYDSKSAHQAGIKFGLAKWGATRNDIEADYVFEDPLAILKVI